MRERIWLIPLTLDAVDYPRNRYSDFSKKTMDSIRLHIHSGEEATKDVDLHKEKINGLLKLLSSKHEINNGYPYPHSLTPDFSLRAKWVITLINNYTPS